MIERRQYNVELNERVARLEAKLDVVIDSVEEKIGDIRDDVHYMREKTDKMFEENINRLRFLEDSALKQHQTRSNLIRALSGFTLLCGAIAWLVSNWMKVAAIFK